MIFNDILSKIKKKIIETLLGKFKFDFLLFIMVWQDLRRLVCFLFIDHNS
ncbi:hypothetical protein K737_301126 [Holospora undulata HU1]|uniref:Uncharacterized protein n=1 Tax=Holospora undulata HU1 TaxID=1321371 RepID=A0A061JGZ5_9PROT|nr:hypothetical protein K737_301126 [Holospora undulata HU1]